MMREAANFLYPYTFGGWGVGHVKGKARLGFIFEKK